MDRRKAKVLYVIRATVFIQKDVPIGPTDGAAIEIVDHGISVAFCIGPPFVMVGVKPFLAPFGEKEVFSWKRGLNVF